MGKKVTTQDFILKAHELHGDKYDYSEVEYKSAKEKVKIICPKHGPFWQTPTAHLNKKHPAGCPLCNGGRKLTTEEFVQKAKELHGDRYDYSKTKYIDNKTKVCIICHEKDKNGIEHGEFWQLPSNHIHKTNKRGCPKCNGGVRLTQEEFIKKAIDSHKENEYDYSLVEYKNSNTPVKIKCNKCGKVFEQLPHVHLRDSGCPHCYGNLKKTTEQFIEDAKKVHGDKYDYSKVNYIDCYHKVEIICNKCGNSFWQEANSHLQGHGCPNCASKSLLEDEINEFLMVKNIEFISQKKFDWLGRQSLDFYLPKYNCGIECQGKQHFIFENSGWNNPKSLEECKERDSRKLNLCTENGVKIFYYSNLGIEYPYQVYEDKELMLNEIINGLE